MKKKKQETFKIGDSVKIKKGIKDNWLNKYEMGGWQGRIHEIYDDDFDEEMCENCKDREDCEINKDGGMDIDIEFDSITLKQIPEKLINRYIENDDDYAMTTVTTTEVEITKARDTVEETRATRLGINLLYNYVSELDQDHDTMFCVTQSGFMLEANGLKITDIPYFALSLSKETSDELMNHLIKEKNEKIRQKKEKGKPDKLVAMSTRKGGLIPIEEFVENIPMHGSLKRLLRNLVKCEAAYFVNDISKIHFWKYIGGGPVRWQQLMHVINYGLEGTKYEKLQGKLQKHFAEEL